MLTNRTVGLALVLASIPLPHPYWLSVWFAGLVFVVAATLNEWLD